MGRRLLRRCGLAALLLLVALALGALLPRPLFGKRAGGTPETRRVLVLANLIHTDIALPASPEVLEAFAFLGEDGLPLRHPDLRWIVFGWGSRAFYTETPTWGELKLRPLLLGLTYDRSVMHVTAAGVIAIGGPDVREIRLEEASFAELVWSVRGSFENRSDGAPILVPDKNYGANDRFYEARGAFTAALGCNTWTAAMLREAGVRTGWWNPLPQTLLVSLDFLN